MSTLRVNLVTTIDNSYDILIESGCSKNIALDIKTIMPASQYVIITDENVYKLYGKDFEAQFIDQNLSYLTYILPAGEHTKSRDHKARIEDFMAKNRCNRDSAIIALGGGVIGDLAGYTASTYFRGVPFIQVPTTLLAMVDSSIGGKTGINIDAGKNLIGSFYQPKKVSIDPDFLQTLPDKELGAGLAEVIKIAATSDQDLFEYLEKHRDQILQKETKHIQYLIEHNGKNKADICMQDEKEHGKRAILNFGHTIGHAVEKLMNFKLIHGECVAIGMCIESLVAVKMGILDPSVSDRLHALIQAYQLPSTLPDGLASQDVITMTKTDKKSRDHKARYVLIQNIGQVYYDHSWTTEVDDTILFDILGDTDK